MVLAYDSQSAQHTVKWENGPGGRTGVTATNLDDGIVTWVKGPDGAGGGRQPFSKPHGPTRETRPTPSSEKKKKQKTNDPGSDSKQKKQKKPPVNRPKSAETLEEVDKRIGSGTIKGICFQVLKDAGPTGLLLSEIVHQTQTRGLKDWSSVNQPSNTVNACCSGDPAFVKVAPGRVGLACLGAVESPDLAAQEEREHGEKVLYCDACRGGPFNTKGMRMHISRWCAFAKGNARGGEGITPKAVTDKMAAAADLAASRQAALERMTSKVNAGGGDVDDTVGKGNSKTLKKWVEPQREPRTIRCDFCGAGPFNEKGAAMHSSRWCKVTNGSGNAPVRALSGGGFGSPFRLGAFGFGGSGGLGGTLGLGALGFGAGEVSGLNPVSTNGKSKKRKHENEESEGLMLPPSPPSMLRGAASFSTGLDIAAMFGNLAGVPTSGAGGAGGGGFARGLIDYMARTFSGGAFSGGVSGGVLGGGVGGDKLVMKATAEQEAPVEWKIDVKVYKEDGNFVARAPLSVPSTVSLGGLKQAVATNTNGALPPNRQRLKYGGNYLPSDDTRLLRDFVTVGKKDTKIEMDLTILHEA